MASVQYCVPLQYILDLRCRAFVLSGKRFTEIHGLDRDIDSIFENEIPISGLGGKIDFYDEKLLSKNNHRCTSSSKRNRAPIFFVVVFSETLIHASKFFRIHDHNR